MPNVGVAALRVLMTADAVGGVWSYVIDLARGLCSQGCQVVVAVLGPNASAAQILQAQIAGLSIVETGLDLDWTASSPAAAHHSGAAIARLAMSSQAQIVHLHCAGLLADEVYPIPVVITSHSCVATWWQAMRGGAIAPQLAWQRDRVAAGYTRANAIIAPTAAFAAATKASYGSSLQLEVVHSGRAPTSIRSNIALGEFVFTSGRLWDPGKNARTLDAAAGRLRWPMLAAGSVAGPNGEHIAFKNLQPLGWRSRDDIEDYLSGAGVYVSAACYEPFGLGVLEAAQAGCPLVLSDIATFRELWGDAAVFVEPNDIDGYVAAITGLMQHPEHRMAAGAAAQARAARYTIDAMVAGTMAVYGTQLVRVAA